MKNIKIDVNWKIIFQFCYIINHYWHSILFELMKRKSWNWPFLFSSANNKISLIVNYMLYNCSFNCENSFQRYFEAVSLVEFNVLCNVALQNYYIVNIVARNSWFLCQNISNLPSAVKFMLECYGNIVWKYYARSLLYYCCIMQLLFDRCWN